MEHTTATDRLHGLDAVRGFALLLGVALHATMSWIPGAEYFWVTADATPSTALAVNMHLVVTGLAAHLHGGGDPSTDHILTDAAAGEIFAFGNSEAGNDLVMTTPQFFDGAQEAIATGLLNESDLDELVVTDTIPLSDEARACSRIRSVSIAALLADTMLRISNEESVSSLFCE